MVYGPGQMDFGKLVPHVLSRVLQGQVAELSSGLQTFDWVFIDDVVEALLATAIRGAGDGRTIDVGCGNLTSVREVALGLATRVGSEGLLRFGAIADRRLEPTRSADLNDTEARIGWRPKISLEEGLERTVDWYRDHFRAAAGRDGGEISP